MPTVVLPVKVPPEVVTTVLSFVGVESCADAPNASVRMDSDASITQRQRVNNTLVLWDAGMGDATSKSRIKNGSGLAPFNMADVERCRSFSEKKGTSVWR